jgi:hypothetical protein
LRSRGPSLVRNKNGMIWPELPLARHDGSNHLGVAGGVRAVRTAKSADMAASLLAAKCRGKSACRGVARL